MVTQGFKNTEIFPILIDKHILIEGVSQVIEKEDWDKYKKKEEHDHQQREELLKEFDRIRAEQEQQQQRSN